MYRTAAAAGRPSSDRCLFNPRFRNKTVLKVASCLSPSLPMSLPMAHPAGKLAAAKCVGLAHIISRDLAQSGRS